MRLIKETYHLFADGSEKAAAQLELLFETTSEGDILRGAKCFAFQYGSIALAGVPELLRVEAFTSAPIERRDNVIQFPTLAAKEGASS